MSKAILIIDIDEKKYNSNVTSISFENRETIFFMKEVKLKPLPSKKKWKIGYVKDNNTCEIFNKNYVDGWNDCIDEILGEEE